MIIRIVSGEGERGTVEPYTGKQTAIALRRRLTRERCGGDRWARAEYLRSKPGQPEVWERLDWQVLGDAEVELQLAKGKQT